MSIQVSVVIPTYNSGSWVEATLESVMRQTLPADALEILVVDDVSQDDSVNIARRFLNRHTLANQVIVREKNGGPGAARNTGWRLAKGNWIQFLDADDLLAPHKIELQAKVVDSASEDLAVVYSNWQDYGLKDGDWQPYGPVNAPFVDTDPVLQILQEINFGYVGPTLIRKSFLHKVGGFEEEMNLGEDFTLMLRLAMAGGQFREARSAQTAFFYRQTPNSQGRVYIRDATALRHLLDSLLRTETFLRSVSLDRNLSEAMTAALASRYLRFADFYAQYDPESFCLIIDHLNGLSGGQPVDINRFLLNRNLRLMSRLIGYKNAIRLRSAYRSVRSII